jgi:hypothetical protein
MFSAFAAGAFLLVTGLIGWNVRNMRGLFQGGRWEDGPIGWQIALGVVLLLLGRYWARRLGAAGWTFTQAPRDRTIKYVGRGKASDTAEKTERRRPLSP